MSDEEVSDDDLVKLFSLDNVEELEAIAVDYGPGIGINTHDGTWVKYSHQTYWRFVPDPDDGDI